MQFSTLPLASMFIEYVIEENIEDVYSLGGVNLFWRQATADARTHLKGFRAFEAELYADGQSHSAYKRGIFALMLSVALPNLCPNLYFANIIRRTRQLVPTHNRIFIGGYRRMYKTTCLVRFIAAIAKVRPRLSIMVVTHGRRSVLKLRSDIYQSLKAMTTKIEDRTVKYMGENIPNACITVIEDRDVVNEFHVSDILFIDNPSFCPLHICRAEAISNIQVISIGLIYFAAFMRQPFLDAHNRYYTTEYVQAIDNALSARL